MHLLASITGLGAGWLAAAAVAGASPVVAHLLARRPRRRIVLPTLRFMASAAHETARSRRLRRRLLLAARALALVSLALAFATPQWTAQASVDETAGGPTVYVLDASASMRRVIGGRTLFDRARERLQREIESSADADAAIVLATSEPSAILPRLSSNTDALLDELKRAEPTDSRANLVRAVASAGAIPSVDGTLPARRIVLVTDAQSTGFEGLAQGEMDSVELIRLGPDAPIPNAAIVEPSVSPAKPVAGGRATVSFTIANFSADDAEIPVTVRVGDRLIERSVKIAPWSREALAIETGLLSEGTTAATVSIPIDAMPLDDTASIDIETVPAHRVGVLASSASPLASAIVASLEHASFLDPVIREVDTSAIVLVETDAMPDQALAEIARFIREGGSALWVIGSPADAELLTRLPVEPGDTPIVRMVDFQDAPTGEPGPSLTRRGRLLRTQMPAGYEHALLASKFSRRAHIETDRPSEIIARFDDGAPFLQRLALGRGSLCLLGASLDPDASNMIASPLFPLTISAIVSRPDEQTRRLAPHLDPRESDPRFLESFERAETGRSHEQAVSKAVRTTDLWPLLLLFACAMLAIESIIDARGKRADRAATFQQLGGLAAP